MQSVIVVGGGIIGLLSAYELNRAGCEVTVIDRQQFGQESTWAGGGIVCPLFPWRYPDPITELSRISQQIYPQLFSEMQPATGIDPEFLPSGMLVLGDHEQEQPRQWAKRLDIPMEVVNRSEIRELAPECADLWDIGYWFPQVHQLRNPHVVRLLGAYLQQTPVKMIADQPVNRLIIEGDRVRGVATEAKEYGADTVVIAGGAWSSSLLGNAQIENAIRPIKGQMLLLKGPPGLVHRITLADDRYVIPRQDGRVLVGSTTEDVGFDKSIDSEIRDDLLAFAARTIPALADLPLEKQWSGLRPASANGIPVIGPHPELKGLFINSGHYRNGVVMGPASARLLSQQLTGRQRDVPVEWYTACDPLHAVNEQTNRSSRQKRTPSTA